MSPRSQGGQPGEFSRSLPVRPPCAAVTRPSTSRSASLPFSSRRSSSLASRSMSLACGDGASLPDGAVPQRMIARHVVRYRRTRPPADDDSQPVNVRLGNRDAMLGSPSPCAPDRRLLRSSSSPSIPERAVARSAGHSVLPRAAVPAGGSPARSGQVTRATARRAGTPAAPAAPR